MRAKTDFPERVVRQEDVGIVLSDGTRLSARIWMPETAETKPVPAILEFLPYRKRDGTIARDCITHPYFAGHGYVCLRVDMRGNGDSDGLMEDEYTPQELSDACEVIGWARSQGWCSGTVGMIGISWGGFNGLQVAALRPEGLKAIITICSTVDRYADDIHYKGGCQLVENLGWASQMLAYSSRPPDPAVVGDRWREMWLHRLENQPFHLTRWLAHQRRDEYWKHGSVCEDYGAIDAAVLSVGGWHDGYRNTISHLVANLSAPVKGLVGPWIHKYPHLAAPEPTIGFLQEALRWWDNWLKGADTGVEEDPAMRLWLMDSVRPAAWLPERPGRWIAEAGWPSPGIAARPLHLTDDGLSPSDGPLSAEVSSPADCGGCCGEFFPFAYGPEFPVDQREDDARSVVFDGARLAEDLDIVGGTRIALTLASDTPQAQIAVRLCDLFPDGTSALITMGVLNLTHHRSHEAPEALTPGAPIDVAFDLDQIAYRIPAGHRLRIAISTAYWPFIWPAPEAATLTLQSGTITIPVRPLADADEWRFDPPEGAAPWDAEELRTPVYTKDRTTDPETGRSITDIRIDAGAYRDREHGLETSSLTEERWSIHPDDPLSAMGEITWTKTMARGDWSVRMISDSRMTADSDSFQVFGRLRAWEGDDLVFDKTVDQAIPRDFM